MVEANGSKAFDDAFELIRKDPYLRAVVKVARSYGISPKRFMGWEPKVYTSPGVMRQEEEWDEETRLLALAYEAWETSLCSGCGHLLSECTDIENEGLYRVGAPTRCHACTAKQIAAEMYQKEAPQPEALLFGVSLHVRDRQDAEVVSHGDSAG